MTKLMKDGNFKDAYEGFRKLTLDPAAPPAEVGDNLRDATQCLQNLGRNNEIDAYCEQVIAVHAKNWRLLNAAADVYLNNQHYGFMVAGQFERGQHRGGGQVVDASARDRIRALQLLSQAMPLVEAEPDKTAAADFYLGFARALLSNRGYQDAWRLQYLSDLTVLPDFDPGWGYGGQTSGAPVDAEGQPIYYSVPESFEKATNDGQRWRWALSHAAKLQPAKLNDTRWELASFCQNQFGVQTIAEYGFFIGRSPREGDKDKDESGTFALHTLTENETIARLATGVRRFKLPDEFNYIKIYEQIAADPKTGHGADSLDALAREFENRRQYSRAAEFWRAAMLAHGKGQNNFRELQLQQIVGNWGRFDGVGTQPAGQGATVDFRFRNGKKVSFDARPVKIDKLLADVKAYLKSSPAQLDWNKLNIGDIGYRLVEQDQTQYVGDRVATWDLELDPREEHFDKRITVTTPLSKAGAYLVTASMADGNTSKIVLWVADTAIIKKPLVGKTFYYVADAVTGAPIEKANLELFGYRQRHLGGNRYQVDVLDSSVLSDATGQAIVPAEKDSNQYAWLAIATTRAGRLAYLGFTHVWGGQHYDAQYNATKVFTITDRPVYRPDQAVHYKLWIRNAQYDQDGSDFGGKTFTLMIVNPKGDKVVEKEVTADQFGGVEGEYKLPADATLGVYQLFFKDHGGGNFRVEEYKKPEFEVTVEAPKKPIMLGEKIQAKVSAKYYFGSPVTEAKVHYKVTRSAYDEPWFPVGAWDWFYGPGYWWFAYDCDWFPGWKDWGCARPAPFWWPRRMNPPEIVAEAEVPIGADGSISIDVDTTLAKEIHGNEDHKYEITAEVVDQSRRTIVGQGKVLVARKPFKVFAWVDRG
ncbi:MAG TPA: MG2 domain-containing protein, partial [Pirellulales bacterium]